jgi:hypothetical protein
MASPQESIAAEIEMLDYLIGIAQNTIGSGVWRALFAEMRLRATERLKALEA